MQRLPKSRLLGREAARVMRRTRCIDFQPGDLSNMHEKASRVLAKLWRRMRKVHVVLWMDNYVRHMDPVDPGKDREVFSVTVCRVMPTRPLKKMVPLSKFRDLQHTRHVEANELVHFHADVLFLLNAVGGGMRSRLTGYACPSTSPATMSRA